MSRKLEILKASLEKKQAELDRRFVNHFADVKSANGQPLNDKRNGQATLNRWEKQSDAIRKQQAEVEKTKAAIEREEAQIAYLERMREVTPAAILELVEAGTLTIWGKYPNMFFVDGVEKGRIVWEKKRKVVAHRYYHLIPTVEQKNAFAKVYNSLAKILNN